MFQLKKDTVQLKKEQHVRHVRADFLGLLAHFQTGIDKWNAEQHQTPKQESKIDLRSRPPTKTVELDYNPPPPVAQRGLGEPVDGAVAQQQRAVVQDGKNLRFKMRRY